MAAALRAAEGGGVYFPKIPREVYSKFFRQGGYTPLPPIPYPW